MVKKVRIGLKVIFLIALIGGIVALLEGPEVETLLLFTAIALMAVWLYVQTHK